MKGHTTDLHCPRRDRRGNKRPQDLTMYGQICGSIVFDAARTQSEAKVGDAARSKAKQQWVIEKSKIDNARQDHVVSSSLNQLMNIFKHTMKNARRKLELADASSNAFQNTDTEQW